MRPSGGGGVSVRQRVGFAVAQVALIAALGWWWLTGETDGTSTGIDWLLVTALLLTPVGLAASSWAGRHLRRQPGQNDPPAARLLTRGAQSVTLALLVVTATICALGALGAVFLNIG